MLDTKRAGSDRMHPMCLDPALYLAHETDPCNSCVMPVNGDTVLGPLTRRSRDATGMCVLKAGYQCDGGWH